MNKVSVQSQNRAKSVQSQYQNQIYNSFLKMTNPDQSTISHHHDGGHGSKHQRAASQIHEGTDLLNFNGTFSSDY